MGVQAALICRPRHRGSSTRLECSAAAGGCRSHLGSGVQAALICRPRHRGASTRLECSAQAGRRRSHRRSRGVRPRGPSPPGHRGMGRRTATGFQGVEPVHTCYPVLPRSGRVGRSPGFSPDGRTASAVVRDTDQGVDKSARGFDVSRETSTEAGPRAEDVRGLQGAGEWRLFTPAAEVVCMCGLHPLRFAWERRPPAGAGGTKRVDDPLWRGRQVRAAFTRCGPRRRDTLRPGSGALGGWTTPGSAAGQVRAAFTPMGPRSRVRPPETPWSRGADQCPRAVPGAPRQRTLNPPLR
ncbi:hypothetical protein SAMN05421803_1261 [Nocardiopsis flavescens]|uniref:Uncharacterized protein n=1 Tax=Nocardiopsis flavescens TaxID=758803 RepID=A0A1M6U358_9ACTN|nr:hypothetical protein SAMN05421803_1261 [Nocardiopsis flavescens]